MGERSEKVAALSETDLVFGFRSALVALYPILQRLDCLEDDTQPYDDFDQVAECLWDVVVRRSLAWKYGLDAPPDVGVYGFGEPGADGCVTVQRPGEPEPTAFVSLIGDREFGLEPFNAVIGRRVDGELTRIPWGPELVFRWEQAPSS